MAEVGIDPPDLSLWSPRLYHQATTLPFEKSEEYWVIKYFKCSDVQNCANLWILRQGRLLDNKTNFLHSTCTLNFYPYIRRHMLQYLLFIYTVTIIL